VSEELYRRARPKTLGEIQGQPEAVRLLTKMVEEGVPHAVLLSGPSGSGKTSAARILCAMLKAEFKELNCADFRGIDTVRDIRDQVAFRPLGGGARAYLIDEGHQLSKDAQSAALKLLEDAADWDYFFIATTDPTKLIPTVRSRCTKVEFKPIPAAAMKDIVRQAIQDFGLPELTNAHLDECVEAAAGNARTALQLAENALKLEPKDRSAYLSVGDRPEVIHLCRALHRGSWPEASKLLKALPDDPEGLRRAVLGYMSAVLLSGKVDAQAARVLEEFVLPTYDSGKPGLVLAAFRACCGKTR
jgi:DNA polymerase III gamma/tau subunit